MKLVSLFDTLVNYRLTENQAALILKLVQSEKGAIGMSPLFAFR